jgi:hypothetical protein
MPQIGQVIVDSRIIDIAQAPVKRNQPSATASRLPFTVSGHAAQYMFCTASVTVFSAPKAAGGASKPRRLVI